MIPEVIVKSERPATDWIEKNIETMMTQIFIDARNQKALPLKITMSTVAYAKFTQNLKSKSMLVFDEKGLKFLGIPVHKNDHLPYGTFTVEWWKA